MTPDRSEQIKAIFLAVRERTNEAERQAYLAAACANDEALRAAVERLLSKEDGEETLVKEPHDWNAAEADPILGMRLGAYQILSELGQGGMGAVYLAERADGAYKQNVAVKFVKRGMDTNSVLRRFRNERQILAALHHPNIALLYDGGTTPDGLPYFVMEYIEGEPLYRYCDHRQLNLQERLKLFVQVCEAVHAAHRIQVVHRDLKPSNILVNASGTPKLLDFGIAKLLNAEMADTTIEPTATQMRVMTPEYASPEQVMGRAITPASDIYSLGVLLYELLSGHRPYRLKNRAPFEIARVICEEMPESLRDSLSSQETFWEKGEAATLENILTARRANLSQLRRELSGDLEHIVMNALHKKPAERYQTALELADDIRLYLQNKPIRKKYTPPVPPPKDSKTSLAVLPLKLMGASWSEDTGEQYLSIGLADALVTRLSRVGRLVVRPTSSTLRFTNHEDVFTIANELGVEFIVVGNIRFVGQRIRVTAQLLNVKEHATHWSESFDEQFTDILELEDSLSEKIGQSLISQLTGEEEQQLGKRGTNSPPAYEAFLKGRFYWNLQSEEGFARAIQYYQRAVEIDPKYAQAYAAIAEYYIFLGIHCVIPFAQGSLAAKEAAEKAIRLDPTLAEGYAALGFAAISFDLDWEKAEALFLRAVQLNENSITAHFWYVAVLAQSQRFDEAWTQLQRVLELDPGSLLGTHMTAWVLYHAHRFDEALSVHEQILKNEPLYVWGLQTYSWVLRRLGRFEEAVKQAEKAVQITGDNPFYLMALAAAYAEAGRRAEAEQLLQKLDQLSPTRFVSEYMLALVHCALGNHDKAFAYLEKSLAARDGWMNWLGVEPQFDRLRSEPRYPDLLRRTGNPLGKKDEQPTPQVAKSIAVLPLQLIGPTDRNNEYLPIGLADAMIIRLSNVRRLIVRPTNAVLRFAGAEDWFAAGRALAVDYVLCGTLRSAGTRIRITAQLLDIAAHTTLWADKFDEEFTDVLALEDLVAEKVAKLLIPKLTGEEKQNLAKRNAHNVEAFEAYLRGKYHLYLMTPDNFALAITYFEKAIALDPSYALPYAALSDAYFTLTGFASHNPRECFPLIEQYAEKALALDERLGDAYANLGMVKSYQLDWRSGEALLQRGLEFNPNQLNGYIWYSVFLTMQGRRAEAIAMARKAYELDPISGFHQYHYIWVLYHTHHFAEATELMQRANQTTPNFAHGQAVTGWIYRHLGRQEEALYHSERAQQLSPATPWMTANLAASLACVGEQERARNLLQQLATQATQYVSPFCMALAYFHLGDLENTFAQLEKSIADRDVWSGWIPAEPQLTPLHQDERFQNLLQKLGVENQRREPT